MAGETDEGELQRKMQEACGLFGCVKAKEARLEAVNVPETVRSGLEQLQHRGNESSGIVGWRGGDEFIQEKGTGLVRSVFTTEKLRALEGCTICIGHNRYSTHGLKDGLTCVQPFVVHTVYGLLGVAHNGQIVNAEQLRNRFLDSGVALSTDTDSELIAQFIAKKLAEKKKQLKERKGTAVELDSEDFVEVLESLLEDLYLSYSLLLLVRGKIYAIRDAWGNRPLCIGKVSDQYEKPLAYVVSSETCAFACMGAKFEFEVGAGSIVELSAEGAVEKGSRSSRGRGKSAFCVFEHIYFSRPDSVVKILNRKKETVKQIRKRCGEKLGEEASVEADIVTTVPESATPAAEGYAAQTKIPFELVLFKNAYVGRSFIQPNTALRQDAVRRKFGVCEGSVRGKRVVLVDDSIVRGNTMGPIVKLFKENGAKEVHIRVASPPIRYPCYYGINIPEREELIATKFLNSQPLAEADLAALARHFNADSVGYLSVKGLLEAVEGGGEKRHCTGCLDASHPVVPPHLTF